MTDSFTLDISIIIPHRDSAHLLPTLLSSIPVSDRIEIILIDNSEIPITAADICSDRKYRLLYSAPERGAGGARNVGIDYAHGKWLLFADADDYFAKDAFEVFFSNIDSQADIIYTCIGGIYLDTGEASDRGLCYTNLVRNFLEGNSTEENIRFGYSSPCGKMIRKTMIDQHHIRFDEIIAGNDMYFSVTSGYYAKQIDAIDQTTYIATVSKGSLTMCKDYKTIKARLFSMLHTNKFLREHNLPDHQGSIMFALVEARHYKIRQILSFVKMIVEFRQNPFWGWSRWLRTFFYYISQRKKDKQYIVR